MKLTDLDDAELKVFIALAKQIIRADKSFSRGEKAWLAEKAEEIGDERWSAGIDAVQADFKSAEDVRAAAAAIERQEARELMHDQLVWLAGSDDYVIEEARILDWLAVAWDIGDHVPMRE